MNKAIFIDKDGTLIKDVPYNVNPDLIELQPYAGEALGYLQSKNFKLIVISNQSGVARGYFKLEDLDIVSEKINKLLSKSEVKIDAFYYCPYFKDGVIAEYTKDSDCRKPRPGMILQAAKDYSVDLSKSWMIGDILNDVEAGNTAGCKTVLVDTGYETEWVMNEKRKPNYIVKDLQQASLVITC